MSLHELSESFGRGFGLGDRTHGGPTRDSTLISINLLESQSLSRDLLLMPCLSS